MSRVYGVREMDQLLPDMFTDGADLPRESTKGAACPTIWFYLAEIYRIQEVHPEATLSMLADAMGVSLQAASRMIRRMAEKDLILREPYRGVVLTPGGQHIALQMVRRHRILEAYLVSVMRFGWDEVHDMVELMERGIPDRIVDRMDDMAGHPVRCPHGEPIPSLDGVMPVVDDQPMTEWPIGIKGQVSRVKVHDPQKLRYLAEVRLLPGTPVVVNAHGPFQGPVHLECAGKTFVLGYQLAAEVRIETLVRLE
jgi:DtxR family Mn-dependent transcriptional regulator